MHISNAILVGVKLNLNFNSKDVYEVYSEIQGYGRSSVSK